MVKISTILLALVGLSACQVHSFGDNEPETDPTTADANPSLVQVGKRNSWEVNAAMATVTGISPEDHLAIASAASTAGNTPRQSAEGSNALSNKLKHNISNAWREVNAMMTRKNGIDGCDPGTQVGTFRLASAYCERLIKDSVAWNNFVKQNFDGADVSKLGKSDIAAVMLDSLQTGGKLNNTQREQSITTIVNYMNDASTESSVSKETLYDVCTMVLGSSATMLN